MKYAVRSFVGTRSEQQDSARVCCDEKGLFAVLCDGMGGRKNGREAAEIAVEDISSMYSSARFSRYSDFCISAAEKTDKKLCGLFGGRCGTTMVSAFVDKGGGLFWMSIGDSRLYIFRNDKMKQITRDHNYSYLLDMKVKKHLINEEEFIRESKKGCALISFLGMGGLDIIDINIEPFRLLPQDIILLTSDGLYKAVDEEAIRGIITSNSEDIETSADKLLECVRTSGGSIDNTTFIIIKHSEEI